MSNTVSDPGLPTAPTQSPIRLEESLSQSLSQSLSLSQSQSPTPLPRRPKSKEFESILLGTRSYILPVGETDHTFRTLLFGKFADGSLTYEELLKALDPDELNILRDTGFIKESFLRANALHIAAFFKALPDCTSDAAVMLKKQCEPSYFLIYALLFHAAQEASAAMESHTPLTDMQLLENAAVLSLAKKQPGEGDAVQNFVVDLLTYRGTDPTVATTATRATRATTATEAPRQSTLFDLLSEYRRLRSDDIFVLYV